MPAFLHQASGETPPPGPQANQIAQKRETPPVASVRPVAMRYSMNEHQTNKASQLTLLDKWRWLGTVAATPSLPAAALAAAHVLADYTGRGGLAFPSYATVAGRTGRSRRSAMRGVVALEHAGLIVAAEGGRRGTRAWRLNVATTPDIPDKSDKPISVVSVRSDQCQERHEGVTRMARGGDMDVTSLVTGLAVSSVEHVTRSPLDIPCDLRQEITGDKSKGSALTPGDGGHRRGQAGAKACVYGAGVEDQRRPRRPGWRGTRCTCGRLCRPGHCGLPRASRRHTAAVCGAA